MTPEERYLFDLQGFLFIPGAIPLGLVQQINDEIDKLEPLSDADAAQLGFDQKYHDDKKSGWSEEYDPTRPRDYDCNILRIGGPFEALIDCPRIQPYIDAMINEPLRLDGYMFMTRNQGRHSNLHHGYAELLSYSEFAIDEGEFKCVSVKVAYALRDVSIEEGSFAVIPGSHKSNFDNPFGGAIPDENHPLIEACPCKAGDAVIFTEDLTHGATINQSNKTRRTLFISYAPAFQTPWGKLVDTADGFEERATPRQLELIKGPSPFAIA